MKTININTFYWDYIEKHPKFTGCIIDSITKTKAYFKNGLLHKEDGPAIEWINGTKDYYLSDKEYSYENWKHEIMKLKLSRVLKKIKSH